MRSGPPRLRAALRTRTFLTRGAACSLSELAVSQFALSCLVEPFATLVTPGVAGARNDCWLVLNVPPLLGRPPADVPPSYPSLATLCATAATRSHAAVSRTAAATCNLAGTHFA